MSGNEIDPTIVTPVKGPGFFGGLLSGPGLPGFAARVGARMARRSGKPFRLASKVIVARHADVCDLLERDLEFGIAAVNAVKIGEVNGGPFILGMDRSAVLETERRALYSALHAVDMAALRQRAEAEIAQILDAVPRGGKLDAVGGYARPVAAHTAQRLFGITGPNDGMFMEAVRSVFAHTFLNIGNDETIRQRAIRAGKYMSGWLADEIARRRAAGETGDDMMGHLLSQGIVDDDGARRTLGGMLVGSIDTTATCVAKIIFLAGGDRELRAGIEADLGDIDRLYGWCNEALRRWPHNPIVIRKASVDCSLAGFPIKAGEDVYAWTQAAMQDESVFPEPERLRPDRDPAAYLHMGAGVHPCSGRPVNWFQIPLLVAGLVRRDLVRVGRIGWAGSFPNRLPVTLGEARS